MLRRVFKCLLGISIAVLILLILLNLGIWVLLNIGGAIFLSLMGNTQIAAIPFGDLMANFVGSPMFYIYLADLAVLLASSIALAVTKRVTAK